MALAVLLLALTLRLYQLDQESIWFDEASAISVATVPLEKFLPWLIKTETNPPLYFLLLRGWISVFGNGEWSVRFLSVVGDMGGLALLYLLGRELLGERGALIGLALGSVSRFEIHYAQEARMYAWLLAFCLGSQLFYWRSRREGGRQELIAWWLFSLAAVYTHLFGWLLIGGQCLHHLLLRRPLWGPRVKGVLALIAAFAPWGAITLHQMALRRGAWWPGRPGLKDYYHLLYRYASNTKLLVLLFCGLIAFGLIQAWRGRQKRELAESDAQLMLLCWFCLPWVIWLHGQFMTPVFVAHYFLFCLPAFWLLIAQGLDRLPSALPWAGLALLLLLTAPRLAEDYRKQSKYPWREIVASVRDRQPRVADVYITGGMSSFLYYSQRQKLGLRIHTPLEGQLVPRYKSIRRLELELSGKDWFWLVVTPYRSRTDDRLPWFKQQFELELKHPAGLYLCRPRAPR